VAAAAGLIVGIGLGQLGQVMPRTVIRPPATASAPPPLTEPQAAERAKELTPELTSHNEEELLSSEAFSRPRVKTLSAIDEMTPHARDVVK